MQNQMMGDRLLLVTGGRDFQDMSLIYYTLELLLQVYGPFTLLHGGARGLDSIVAGWAQSRGQSIIVRPADWNTHGVSAGRLRNQEMVDMKPFVCVSFPGGLGTADCTKRALDAGIKVIYAHQVYIG